ncbi:MAG TPA: DUF1844 domain-containing protein [Smithella sp.]|nr:DUF1844 domain-containing protein [Smithella sp.]
MSDKKEGTGFVVKDKRFSSDTEETSPGDDLGKKRADEGPQSTGASQPADQFDYPPVNFTNFVLSLSTSALFHFGDFADEEGEKVQKNLPAAKQTIDILDMLSEKTKGNLDDEERKLLQSVLYELKMRYVKEKS